MLPLLKSALNLLNPLGLVWAGLLLLLLSLIWRQLKGHAILAGGLWILLTVSTCFPFWGLRLSALEDPWRGIAGRWDALPMADAIVCLGGGASISPQEVVGVNLFSAGDRPVTAVELLRRGKAPRLLIGGGGSPDKGNEADAVKAWLALWQLSTAEITSLGKCLDTHDEAEKVATLARQHGWKRILLVTSDSHMKRAQAVFQKSCGIEIIAVPCAFESDGEITEWMFLPNPGELDAFAVWFNEVLGWWAYRARGWI
jgi:uncharacterized SAM-binding protein YcdF (DUF218 family)